MVIRVQVIGIGVLIMVIRALVIGIMVLIMTEAMQRRPRSFLAAHTKRFPRGSREGFVEYGRIR